MYRIRTINDNLNQMAIMF